MLALVGSIIVLIFVLAVLAAVGVVGFGAMLAQRSKRDYDASNQVVPGRATSVPSSWAGSHDSAAVLHRRLVAAMAALRANQAFDDDGGLLDLRVELEQQAMAIDDRLVAVDALPATVRAEPLRQVTEATVELETAVGNLASRSVAELRTNQEATLAELRQRSGVLDEIRRQLDATDGDTGGVVDVSPAADPAIAASPADPETGTAQPG